MVLLKKTIFSVFALNVTFLVSEIETCELGRNYFSKFQNHPASLSSPCPFTDTARRHNGITEFIQDSNTVGYGGREGLLHPSWC